MSHPKRRSMRALAKELGVSPATVSRIASGIGSFSEETEEKVTQALLREGYRIGPDPDPSPQTVAAIVTDLSNEVYHSILTALGRYLKRKGFLLQIFTENQDQRLLLHQVEALHVSGLFLIGTPLAPVSEEASVPAVQVLSGNAVSWQGQVYTVFSDEYVGGRLAARCLLEKGCRLPIILNNRHTSSADSRRIQGFLSEWTEEGLSAASIYLHDGEPFKSAFNSAHDITAYLKAKGQPFDSVFACSDWRAYGAIVALRSLHVAVPEEVKVIGFDGERVSRYCDLPFTTIQQNPDMIASAAFETLCALMEGKYPAASTLVPVQVQKGLTI